MRPAPQGDPKTTHKENRVAHADPDDEGARQKLSALRICNRGRMINEKFTDVCINADGEKLDLTKEVNGALPKPNYRIVPFSPTIGTMMAMQVTSGRFLTDETVYGLVRGNCLAACSIYIEKAGVTIPMRIYGKASGAEPEKWLVTEDQRPSPAAEMKLIMEVIDANLSPFLGKPASSKRPGDSNTLQSNSQTT